VLGVEFGVLFVDFGYLVREQGLLIEWSLPDGFLERGQH